MRTLIVIEIILFFAFLFTMPSYRTMTFKTDMGPWIAMLTMVIFAILGFYYMAKK